MDLLALADKLSVEIVLRRAPSRVTARNVAWVAYFEGAGVKAGAALDTGVFGEGSTPHEAIVAYAAKISGKRMILDAMGQGRETLIPKLEV